MPPPGSPPEGGAKYWLTGSETEKNMRSTPMPAAKSIAVHVNMLNCGRAWSGPMRTLPPRLAATMITKPITTVAVRM